MKRRPLGIAALATAVAPFLACFSSNGSGSNLGDASSTSSMPDVSAGVEGGSAKAGADAEGHAEAASESMNDAGGADQTIPDSGAAACSADGATRSDPFEGVWTDTQGSETWTVTNGSGCSMWVGAASGTVCDYCVGTYAVTGTNTGNSTLSCTPRSSCSVSPAHTDVGALVLSSCSFTYTYNYGGGSSNQTLTRVSDAPGNVCGLIEAGTD